MYLVCGRVEVQHIRQKGSRGRGLGLLASIVSASLSSLHLSFTKSLQQRIKHEILGRISNLRFEKLPWQMPADTVCF